MFIPNLIKVGVIIAGTAVQKMQLNRTARESGNDKEVYFTNQEEALEYFRKL